MATILRIIFAMIFLVAIIYLAILGLTAFFEWLNPGGGAGRSGRITTGVIIGLGLTIGIIAFRRFFGRS